MLKDLQSRLPEPMKRFKNKKYGEYGNLFDLEKVFQYEMKMDEWEREND